MLILLFIKFEATIKLPMKIIFILLLGFGGVYPITCSKKETKPKQESYLKYSKAVTSVVIINKS
jgi:hypothetical protein